MAFNISAVAQPLAETYLLLSPTVDNQLVHQDEVLLDKDSWIGVQVPNYYKTSVIENHVFIDNNLPDQQLLRQAFQNQFLEGYHLFSHGRPGELLIDGQWKTPQQIAAWLEFNESLANQSQLNIYGCNFAQGEKGREAVQYLELTLGVTVAASDDITGVDGDWELELGSCKNGLTIQGYSHNLQQGTLPIQPGMAATTCGSYTAAGQFSSDPKGYVFGIFDIREPDCDANGLTDDAVTPDAPNNWTAASGSNAYHHPSWINENLGEVFGVDLEYDQASSPDIFLSSCGLVDSHLTYQLPRAGGTGGEVFRIDGTTGNITVLATLPSTIYETEVGDRAKFTGLGNLSYNADQQKVYVTNLDDGNIYVVDATTTNVIDQTHNPTPNVPDMLSESRHYTPRARMVYGIEYNKCENRLYFARPNTLTTVDIFSVGLNADGTIDESANPIHTLEATITVETNVVISDIELSDDCTQMLTSERKLDVYIPNQQFLLQVAPHYADVKRHDLSGGTWSIETASYDIGSCSICPILDKNGGGGVSFGYGNYGACGTGNACDDAMVATSDALVFTDNSNIYGLQISDIAGTSNYPSDSYFVDLDGNTGTNENADKTTNFDVDVFAGSCVSCTAPSNLAFTQSAPTCAGETGNDNGSISLSGHTDGTHYGVSTLGATTYDGPTSITGGTAATAIGTLPQIVQSNVPNTGGSYIIRIFNGADECYTDDTVTVAVVPCIVIPPTYPPTYACTDATVIIGDLIPSGGGQTVAFPFDSGATSPTMCTEKIGYGGEGIAYCSSNNRIYIAKPSSGRIIVWDPATNSAIDSISAMLSNSIYDIALSSTCDKLYIASGGGLERMDLTTMLVDATRSVADLDAVATGDGEPWGIDIHPTTGDVYTTFGWFSNQPAHGGGVKESSILKVAGDLSGTITEIVPYESDGLFMGMKFMADGTFWVTWDGDEPASFPDPYEHSEEIRQYDAAGTLIISHPIIVGGNQQYFSDPNDIAFGPDGSIYVTTYAEWCAIRYIPGTNTWEEYLPIDPSGATGKNIEFACTNFLCCEPPTAITFSQVAPTCTGGTSNNDGSITLTGYTNGSHYGVSTLGATTYDGPTSITGGTAATAIVGTPVIHSTVPNTGGSYIVRIFNYADSCYTEETVTVAEVICQPCAITASGLTTPACNNVNTSSIEADDYITFDLNPTGISLVTNYTLTVSGGATITPSTGTYGSATSFQLQAGSAGAGDVTVTITDDIDASCTFDVLIADPGSCSNDRIDLELTKVADKSVAKIGDDILFTLELKNEGNITANGIIVNDDLPSSVTFKSASSSTGSYDETTGEWSIDSLEASHSLQLFILAELTKDTIVCNITEVIAVAEYDIDSSPNNDDGDQSEDDEDKALVFVQPEIDLSVTKVVSQNLVAVGDAISYTISVKNDGPSIAHNVKLYDQLPAGLTQVGVATGNSDQTAATWAYANDTLTMDSISVGETITLTVNATVASINSAITNCAEIVAADEDDVDSVPGNAATSEEDDEACAIINPVEYDIELLKDILKDGYALDSRKVKIGDEITYVLRVTNFSSSGLTGVMVKDLLPVGVEFQTMSGDGTYDEPTGEWTIGNVSPKSQLRMDIVVKVIADGMISNTAEVSEMDQADKDSIPGNGVETEDDQQTVTMEVVKPKKKMEIKVGGS